MKQSVINNELRDDRASLMAGKKGARDADILLLLWEVFKTRANEIDSLLDLSLSILSTATHFPQKTDLESSLKKALFLIRNFA